MNELVTVNFDNQRVLTTRQLADVYGTTHVAISQNFKNNQRYFKEGVHYYLLKGAVLKEFKNQLDDISLVDKRTAHLYLWTERGANRHCKILDTDMAWEQFDNLEDTYFRVKEYVQNQFVIPKTYSEALRLAADIQAENERLKEQEQLLLPKANGYDLIVNSDGTQSMNAFAKSMNWGRNRLFAALRENGIFLEGTTVPKQRFINEKHFIVKQCKKGRMVFPVTFITPKGMKYIVNKVNEWGIMDDLRLAGLMT